MTRPDSVRASAPAKVNLHLGVAPVRPDGFHPVCTVYLAVDLRDEVTVSRAEEMTLRVLDPDDEPVPGVPLDDANIVWRAARTLLVENGLRDHLDLEVRKTIPVAGGLAGGSADAAATLLAVDALLGLETPPERLRAMAAGLGSDVPFALLGGAALGRGRGEQLEPVDVAGALSLVLVESTTGLSTQRVYAELDTMDQDSTGLEPPADLLAALAEGDLEAVAGALANDLQAPALVLRPDLTEALAAARGTDALAVQLSGSGPTLLLLATDEDVARRIADGIGRSGRPAHKRVLVASGPAAGARLEPDVPDREPA